MSQRESRGRSTAEALTLVVSGFVVAAVVGALIAMQVTGAGEPASFEVTLDPAQVRVEGDVFYLPMEVRNRGGRGAEHVRVDVIQQTGGRDMVAQVAIDALAGGARERAVVVLREDPRRTPARAEVRSYIRP